jgi:MYXO-CTERM domain-containing protein
MRSALLVTPLLAFALAACATEPEPEPVGEAHAPIIGGIHDTFRSYVVGVGDEKGAFCTGTLISRRTVLTAGHCYSKSGGLQGGITRIYFGPDVTARGSWVGTAQAVRHPMFNKATLSHDLTMVELDSDAPSQAAPLLRETMESTPEFVGPNFTFVGYGNDGSSNYGIRRVAVFPILAVGPAGDVGKESGTGPIDASQFYYRAPSKNTCDGDSGGPAFLPRDGVERLAGATSYGDGPCLVDGVDARTDLPEIKAFIQPMIDAFEGMDPCRADGVCNESCNTGGQLRDPDCAPNHCGADGICVISCVDPPDPDCMRAPRCELDGVCDPTCGSTDPDCVAAPAGDATTSAGAGGSGGREATGEAASSSTATTSATTTSASGGGAGGMEAGSGGAEPGPGARANDSGGCSMGGDASGAGGLGLLALGTLVTRLRRRRAA